MQVKQSITKENETESEHLRELKPFVQGADWHPNLVCMKYKCTLRKTEQENFRVS